MNIKTKIPKGFPGLFLLSGIFTAEIIMMSIRRYRGFNAFMLDLGNMSQAIWSATQGKALIVTRSFGTYSRLAGHAEIIYFLIAPFYAIAPSPETLLILQALLYAAGTIPVFVLANRKLQNSKIALVFSAIYLLYPVAQTAVFFDFHGDTLAMPFLLLAIEAADRKAWRSYSIWIGLALMCKYYIAVPIFFMGLILWLNGHRRIGIFTGIAAGAWFVFTLFGLKLMVYGTIHGAQQATSRYVTYYFENPLPEGTMNMERIGSALIIFTPTLLLGLRSALWLLPASSIAIPSLAGTRFLYHYHHYAATVPFFMASMIYGAEQLRAKQKETSPKNRKKGRTWKGDIVFTLLLTLIMNVAFVISPLSPLFYLGGWTEYEITSRDRLKDQWLRNNVLVDAPVAANPLLAPHISNREVLYTQYHSADQREGIFSNIDIFVTDAFFEHSLGSDIELEKPAIEFALRNPDFGLTDSLDALLLFQRGEKGLYQNIEVSSASTNSFLTTFNERIGLRIAKITSLGSNLFRMRCEWIAIKSMQNEPFYFAASRVVGLENSRILHLPSYTLLPTTDWPVGQIIIEEFEFRLPENLPSGEYPIVVGWYNSAVDFDARLDEHNRIGTEFQIGTLHLP
jgi:uncharacterized membrane protein